MRERRVDFHRLSRDPFLLFRRHRPEGAHVVETVAELDQEMTRMSRAIAISICESFPPDVLPAFASGLCQVLVTPSTRSAMSDPEHFADVVDGGARVFNAVVQQAGTDAADIQSELRDDFRDGKRVNQVRISRLAELALMGVFSKRISPSNKFEIGRRLIRTYRVSSWLGRQHSRTGFTPAMSATQPVVVTDRQGDTLAGRGTYGQTSELC